ncbi:MAG: group III truncated hemoglobin [Flavobacteriales bacterium]|jgi:hemoglobin|nr:group III truncated hemoglobin [Flavobacteriales bacterium]
MRSKRTDITTREHIEKLVDGFYAQVRIDPLLGGVFNGAIGDRWPEHLEKMYRFWGTVLLNEGSYNGAPFRPHATMPLEQKHFDRWLMLFHATVSEHFEGLVADLAHMNADRMAAMFMSKITMLRERPDKFIQ